MIYLVWFGYSVIVLNFRGEALWSVGNTDWKKHEDMAPSIKSIQFSGLESHNTVNWFSAPPSSQPLLPHPTNTLMEINCFQVRNAYLYCSTMMQAWQSILISPLKQILQNSAPGPPEAGCPEPYSGWDPPPLGIALSWHKHHGAISLWFPLLSLDYEQLETNCVLSHSVFSTVPVTSWMSNCSLWA